MAPVQELTTASGVAKQLRVSPDTVRRWVRDGRLAAITLPSGQLRFRQSDVDKLLDQPPADESVSA